MSYKLGRNDTASVGIIDQNNSFTIAFYDSDTMEYVPIIYDSLNNYYVACTSSWCSLMGSSLDTDIGIDKRFRINTFYVLSSYIAVIEITNEEKEGQILSITKSYYLFIKKIDTDVGDYKAQSFILTREEDYNIGDVNSYPVVAGCNEDINDPNLYPTLHSINPVKLDGTPNLNCLNNQKSGTLLAGTPYQFVEIDSSSNGTFLPVSMIFYKNKDALISNPNGGWVTYNNIDRNITYDGDLYGGLEIGVDTTKYTVVDSPFITFFPQQWKTTEGCDVNYQYNSHDIIYNRCVYKSHIDNSWYKTFCNCPYQGVIESENNTDLVNTSNVLYTYSDQCGGQHYDTLYLDGGTPNDNYTYNDDPNCVFNGTIFVNSSNKNPPKECQYSGGIFCRIPVVGITEDNTNNGNALVWLWVILAFFIVAVIIGIIIYVYFNMKTHEEELAAPTQSSTEIKGDDNSEDGNSEKNDE
jgi:hypothetical protein